MSNLKKMPGTARSLISVLYKVAAYWLVMIVLEEVEPGGRLLVVAGPSEDRSRDKGKKENGEKNDGEEGRAVVGGDGVRVYIVGTTER